MLDESIKNAEEAEFLDEWNREFSDEQIALCCADNYRDQGYSQKEIQEKTTLVIDYATGEKITLKDCKDKYGEEIAKELLQAKKGIKELEPEVRQEIEDIHKSNHAAKPKPDNVAPQKGRNYTKKNSKKNQYVPMPFKLIYDPEFRQFFKGKYLTYAFLRCYIVRGDMKIDKLKLYEKYFLKGKLASSWSINGLANNLRCSPNTIRKHIGELRRCGCIKRTTVPPKEAWDNQKHHIYLFGTHDGNKNEKFFLDDVFGIPAVPDGQGVQ